NGQIPALANELGLPVFAGAWIDYPTATQEQDDAEIQALINLACTKDLAGLIVGNEYYLRHRSPVYINYLVQRIREVKEGVARCGKNIPVTTAEIDDLIFGWQGNPPTSITGTLPVYQPVLNEIDFVMVHIYPFWSRMPIEGAAAFVVNRYQAIQGLLERNYPGKWLIIGETGWPSGGRPNGAAVPNPLHQQKYLLEFLSLAEREGVHFLYFDAFDELWKVEEPGGVGKHWGYSYTDRSAKYSFYGVLLPAAHLPTLSLQKVYLPLISRTGPETAPEQKLVVYDEWPEEHFVPSGWMGDIDHIEFFGCDRSDPHSGEMAIRISYTPGPIGWAGIYWQYPENNWGNINKGLDIRWANKVTFWAKGEKGGEKIRFFVGGIGTKNDPYPDSWRPQASTGFVELSTQWQKYGKCAFNRGHPPAR
ncbi:MAG: glycosyl hydrolase family 17 protein, partial [Anaerolineae bacterium]